MLPNRKLFSYLSYLVPLVLAGCARDDGAVQGPTPVQTAPALPPTDPVVVETDDRGFPVLPSGTGAIDEDAPAEFQTTASGLRYRLLRKTDGKKPKPAHHIVVNYRGWLDDGTEFDSSYRSGRALEKPLRELVQGWIEGLQFVGKGGMIELEIPPEMGYGAAGSPPTIPPNATLHFLVELKDVR